MTGGTLPVRSRCNSKYMKLLKKQGTLIDDMDLFIGCTAIGYNLVMVTENVKHLSRLKGINIENWVIREKNG